jgi:hypothetical protein
MPLFGHADAAREIQRCSVRHRRVLAIIIERKGSCFLKAALGKS